MVALLSQARLKSSLTPRFNQVPDDFYRVFEARAYPTETSLQHAEIKKEDLLYWAQKSPALDQRGMLPTSHFKLIWVLADNDHGQKGIAQSQFWDLCKAFCIDTSLSLYESHRFDSLYYSERHHGQTPACLSFYFRILDAIVYSSFIPATETKRAILFAPRNVAWEDFFFASLRTLSISNPLSLYAWLRATQSENIQTRLQSAFSIVYQVEIDTGYSTSLDPLDVPPGYNPPMNPDLSELSKAVGSAANGIDRACLMIRFSKSLRMVLSTDNGLRWQELFNDSRRDKYMAECHKMFKIDDIVQSILDQYLIKASVYEQRSRNLLNVIFNLIAREEAAANIKLAQDSRMLTNASVELAKDSRTIAAATMRDSSAMKTVAILTMTFLPATFFAALFALPVFQWNATPVLQPRFWVYWAFTIPFTVLVFAVWFIATSISERKNYLADQKQRQEIVKRTATFRQSSSSRRILYTSEH